MSQDVYEQLRHPLALSTFLLTLCAPILVGWWTKARTRNQSDFFLGGRTMNRFVVALSAVSSGRSSWLVLGVTGIAYSRGASAVWALVGYIVVELFQFIYVGQKLRSQSEAYGSITVLDYFESRFGDRRQIIRWVGAIIIAVFITAYVSAQFNAGAKSLSTALELPFLLALLVSALLILVYMIMGGFVAVAYNDVIRAIIMLVGLVILPLYGLIHVHGLSPLLHTLKQLDPSLVDPLSLGAGALLGFVGIGLGSPGQPHIVVRYMSIDDSEQLRWSAVIGTIWNVLLGWGALFVGLLGRCLHPDVTNLPNADPEMIYLVLSSDFFGPLLYGLLVGGVFAAILSTADSQLLVVASTFARDIYEKIIKKKETIDETRKLALSRIVVLIAGAAALVLAYTAEDYVFWLVLFAWGGLGASFGPAFILALYWPKTSRAGILAGMISGSTIIVIWRLLLKDVTGLYELIPAFFGSFLAIVLVSLLWPDRDS